MKDLLLKVEDEDYETLEWISSRLNVSISELLRSLIPRIAHPESRVVTDQNEIVAADPADLVPVAGHLEEAEQKELDDVLRELQEKNWGAMLAGEIRRQILNNKHGRGCLSVGTYKRLSRWATPHRWSEREQFVQPRAQRISEILFGRKIDRVD
jgi:hypothetical protein